MEINVSKVVTAKYINDIDKAYVLRNENNAFVRFVVIPNGAAVSVVPMDKFFKAEVKLVSEYCIMQGNLTAQSVDYLISNNKVDYIKLGKTAIIVMSDFTREYTPNNSKSRKGSSGSEIIRS